MFIGLHPYNYEYRQGETLEILAKEFENDHEIVGLKGVTVYEVDKGYTVKLGYTLTPEYLNKTRLGGFCFICYVSEYSLTFAPKLYHTKTARVKHFYKLLHLPPVSTH